MKKQTSRAVIIISLVLIGSILTNCENKKNDKASDNIEDLITNCLKKNNWDYSIRAKTNPNDKITILTEQDDIELRISIDPERNAYHILGYINTIVPDACRTKAIIEINNYNNMGAVAPGVITDYGLIVFGLWQHTDSNSFSDEIFMDDLFTTMYSIKYGTRQVLDSIELKTLNPSNNQSN